MTANFGSGLATAAITAFQAQDPDTEVVISNPLVDSISVTDMAIIGSSLVGGTVEARLGQASVALGGPDPTSDAQGNFFGYDAAIGGPDEVGGVAYLEGSGDLVFGIFTAD